MRFFETAEKRPSSFREWFYRYRIFRLMEKAAMAKTEEDRQRLIEDRKKLIRELSGMIETRG